MAVEDKTIAWGHPSYVWRFGQERRLALMRRYAALEDRAILDIGCGIGVYVSQFRRFSPHVFGIDIDPEKLRQAKKSLPNLVVARGEDIPFADASFDVVFLHEVLEHVADDARTVREAVRVARVGGKIVIYVPNRLYPFETHGFYLGRRYIFGLVPLVNYFPDVLRRRLVPHVRAYRTGDLRGLFDGLPVRTLVHTFVYPGFDAIASRRPGLARFLRRVCYFAEGTALRRFGLSHFLVVEKLAVEGNRA